MKSLAWFFFGFLICVVSNCSSWGKFWDVSTEKFPRVSSISPADGAAGVSVPRPVVVTFDRDMSTASVTTATSGSTCTGSLQFSLDNFSTCLAGVLTFPSLKQVSFVPTSPFCVESQYALQVRVQTSVKSSLGYNFAATYTGTVAFSTQQALLKVGVTTGTNVYALLVGCNTLYVGGAFTQIGGLTRTNLAAIDLTTGLLNSYDSTNFSAAGAVNALALDGVNLIAGGVFTVVGGGVSAPYLAQFNTLTGLANSSWNTGLNATVNGIAVSNGSIYVAGNFTTSTCGARNRLALFTSASNVCDGTWNPGSSAATVNAIAVSGSTVFVGGSFTGGTIGAVSRNFFASVSATGVGAGNAGFCTGGTSAAVSAIAVKGSVVYAGGGFGPGLCGPNNYSFGAVDATSGASVGYPNGAGAGANNTVSAVSVSNTTVFVGGAFNGAASFFSGTRNYTGATDHAGVLQPWDPNLNGNVTAIANVGSAVFLGGAFTTANGGTTANRLTLVDAMTGTIRP